jgi:hypothetical protein
MLFGSLVLLVLWVAASTPVRAQSPTWQSVLAASGDVQVTASAPDGQGNVYIVGGFGGTAVFGTTTLSTTNSQEPFVAKWSSAGNSFVWAIKGTSTGSTGQNRATAVAVFGTSVYVAGFFVGQTLALGSAPALTNAQAGTSDIFWARLRDNGVTASVSLAKRAGGTGTDNAAALAVSSDFGYLYLGGVTSGNAIFDNYTLAGAGGFVARYNLSSGTAVPVSPAPVVPAGDNVTALAYANSAVYAAGTFSGAASPVPGGTLSSAGGSDAFVLKLAASNLTTAYWAQRAGGVGDDVARCLAVSGSSVYVGGNYLGASATFGTTTLTNTGTSALFVSRLNDAGATASFAWAVQSTSGAASALALATYGTSVYAAGILAGTVGLGGTSLTSAGGNDVLVAKLTDAGGSASFVGAQQAGGTGADYAYGIGQLDTRNWYVAGYAASPATFGPQNLTATGARPGFVATFFDNAPLLTLAAPNAGPVGTTITLYGQGLAGATSIAFAGSTNNVVTTGFTASSNGTQISNVVVPAGAQSGPITVTTAGGSSNGLVSYTVVSNSAPAWASVQGWGTGSLVSWAAPAAGGTVLVAGEFSGSIGLGTTTLTSAGGRDLFVAKYNPTTGTYLWAVRAGGAADEDVYGGLAVSGTSVYLAGQFYGPSLTLGSTALSGPANALNGYVAKLTDNGSSASFSWAQAVTDASGVFVESLAVSGSSVYVGGDYTGSALAVGSSTLSGNVSGDDGYVAKLTDNGSTATVGWVQSMGSADGSTINVYGLSANGPVVYLTGTLFGTVSFGSTALSSAGSGDVAVARLLDNGTSASFTAAVRAGGVGNEYVLGLSRQGSNLYVSGQNGTSIWPGTTLTGSPGSGFVAKVTDTNGTLGVDWVQLLSGAAYQTVPNGAAVYAVAQLYGSATLGGTTLSSAGGSDGLVVRLADAGSTVGVSWARSAGGLGTDQFSALALAGGQVVVGGIIRPAAAFGPLVLASPAGVPTAFVATLADPLVLASAPAALAPARPLYPNPAHDYATVPVAPGTTAVRVLDALGREVRRQAVAPGATEATLGLAGLPAGLYLVQAGAGATPQRLLVE